MSSSSATHQADGPNVEATLTSLARRLQEEASVAPGDCAVFHLTGPGGGSYCLEHAEGEVRIADPHRLGPAAPQVEVIGEAAVVCAILNGERDARRQFFKGGLRVRGNLRYLSDRAMEVGVLKNPL
ncbi:SCP2 sterol-binding domain-containing protein [Nocardia amamiensis]|uniref:SCP2 sterol-binding domain-containing protein n=1 Tax=Nocardia amamiensis TaxID=404578 RepID=UPI0033DD265C